MTKRLAQYCYAGKDKVFKTPEELQTFLEGKKCMYGQGACGPECAGFKIARGIVQVFIKGVAGDVETLNGIVAFVGYCARSNSFLQGHAPITSVPIRADVEVFA